MPIGMWFWVLYVLCLLFWGWSVYDPAQPFRRQGGGLAFFVLIGLLGYAVFAGPIK
jgi:hypothetical protein